MDGAGGPEGSLEGAAAAAAGAQGRPLRALAAELLERAPTAEDMRVLDHAARDALQAHDDTEEGLLLPPHPPDAPPPKRQHNGAPHHVESCSQRAPLRRSSGAGPFASTRARWPR